MNFIDISKFTIQNILNKSTLSTFKLNVNILSCEENSQTGLTTLSFELNNHYINIIYTFSFGYNEFHKPFIYTKKYKITSEFDYNTPVPYTEIVQFINSDFNELLNDFILSHK